MATTAARVTTLGPKTASTATETAAPRPMAVSDCTASRADPASVVDVAITAPSGA
ncbi:hypothetical protein SAMN04488085_10738 [Geodermatophilus ruber]|uniref:Uncharacterized protein n=1 Tax=Geodermatophilus ruber TaxID=504800 RepID=A0A1I4F8N2_9ACTN|nr:hypothetical protein SAMN04488085_10738 [Geodermatophilus ruber]